MVVLTFYCLITADDKKLCTEVHNYISEATLNNWNKILLEQVFK